MDCLCIFKWPYYGKKICGIFCDRGGKKAAHSCNGVKIYIHSLDIPKILNSDRLSLTVPSA